MLRPGCHTTCLCIEKKKKPATNFFPIASIIKLNKPTFTPSKHSKWKVSINYPSTNGHWRTAHGENDGKGAAALSDAELLAILIGSGNTEESAVELMRRLLLSCDNNLNSLAKWEVCDYSRFKGMGPAKSITVMAALELGKRRKLQNTKRKASNHLFKRYL